MRKALLLTLVSLAIFNCATQQPYVSGEKCYAPVWLDGDSWKFIGGGNQIWEEKFVGSTLRQTPQKGFYAIFNIPFVGLKLFPLWVGKKVGGAQQAQNVEGYNLMWNYSFRVLGIEDLKIEAGTFKAYKIEFRLSSTIHREEGVAYYYYAPETKSIVKFETKSQILYEWQDYELLSYQTKADLQPTPNKKALTPKQFTPPPSKNMVAVIGTSTNIRSGAGNEFSVITSVKQGEKLILLGEHGEWFNIRLENGQEGWISKMFTVPTSKTMNQIDLTDLSSLPRLWEGSWESKKNVTRGGSIKVNIIDVRENKLNGTIIVYNSVCPSASQFRGEVKNGKLIISADLGHPCGEMKAEAEPHGEGLQGLYEVGIPDFGSIRIHPK